MSYWKEWMIRVVEAIEKTTNFSVKRIEFDEEESTVHLVVFLNTGYIPGEEFKDLVEYLNRFNAWGIASERGSIAITLTKMKV